MMGGKNLGKDTSQESSWDRCKVTKMWAVFHGKKIKRLPKGCTRYTSCASFKKEGEKKKQQQTLVSYSIRAICTLANGEVL